MPNLDSALLGLLPLRLMKPNFDWEKSCLRKGFTSYPFKKYSIGFNDIATVIGNDDKVKYFENEHNVRIHISNDYGHTMILTICALKHDVDIDLIGTIISYFAPSLKPV
ncbi:unnamed protein product [Adineta ricciae]|uniref:Uncharacterized protein n=1 Tax=Adineta ricciae TaxID=249248 RepID=A0A815LW21_ADIRI|nr:unnamed protein product [Adineta ricciae]CAF1414714.1 unnamed protein product [Adineta ricciae]